MLTYVCVPSLSHPKCPCAHTLHTRAFTHRMPRCDARWRERQLREGLMAGFRPWCENADPLFDPSFCFPAAWYTHTHTPTCAHTYTCVHIYTCVTHMHALHICVHAHASMHRHRHVHAYIPAHTCTFFKKRPSDRQRPARGSKRESQERSSVTSPHEGLVHPSCRCLPKGASTVTDRILNCIHSLMTI